MSEQAWTRRMARAQMRDEFDRAQAKIKAIFLGSGDTDRAWVAALVEDLASEIERRAEPGDPT